MDAPKTPLGTLIDKLAGLREKKRKLAEQEKLIDAEFAELEETLKQRLLGEGMDKATGKKATISIKEEVVANIVDWEALTAYVKKTGHFHLFQRRVSNPAFRELAALNKSKGVPGLQPFTKLNLNLTALKS